MDHLQHVMGDRLPYFRKSMERHWLECSVRYPKDPLCTWDRFAEGLNRKIAVQDRFVVDDITEYLFMASREQHLDSGPVTVDTLMAWADDKHAILAGASSSYGECGCMGPARGNPVCSCRMKNVAVMDGRWVWVTGCGAATDLADLGPVSG